MQEKEFNEVKQEVLAAIKRLYGNERSTWGRMTTEDAEELIDSLVFEYSPTAFDNEGTLAIAMLNGADSWSTYSYDGCALCYDFDIAKRYCTPSELKKKRDGELMPNRYESWLDVQARALKQAARKARTAYLCAIRKMRAAA